MNESSSLFRFDRIHDLSKLLQVGFFDRAPLMKRTSQVRKRYLDKRASLFICLIGVASLEGLIIIHDLRVG